jgi:lipopolysaccharide transport system permease protein
MAIAEPRIPRAEPEPLPEAIPVIRIEHTSGWLKLGLRDLWEHRELLYFLVWRDVKVRYKQTVLGAAWAILQPVMSMVIFTVIFSIIAKMPSDGFPYPIFSFAALLPWTYFSGALGRVTSSVVGNAQLVSKVYFPRLIIPLAGVVSGLVDFAISFVVLIAMMIYYRIQPTWAIVTLPLFLILATATALGIGLWLAALNTRYRDVGYIIPFLIQFWMYACPVIYAVSAVPERWRLLYSLNPMVGVIEGFRWALLGNAHPNFSVMAVSSIILLVLLFGGLVYFKRMERTFADLV